MQKENKGLEGYTSKRVVVISRYDGSDKSDHCFLLQTFYAFQNFYSEHLYFCNQKSIYIIKMKELS